MDSGFTLLYLLYGLDIDLNGNKNKKREQKKNESNQEYNDVVISRIYCFHNIRSHPAPPSKSFTFYTCCWKRHSPALPVKRSRMWSAPR